MAHVKSIDVKKLLPVYLSLREAAPGALLQMRVKPQEPPLVGMHCLQRSSGGDVHGVLQLEGDSAGEWIFENTLGFTGAVDVSRTMRILACEPALRPVDELMVGHLYYGRETSSIYMWSHLVQHLMVCIFDPKADRRGQTEVMPKRLELWAELGKAKLSPVDEDARNVRSSEQLDSIVPAG
jgi:hypothetical protein